MTRCTVLIPTWHAPDSLGAAVTSALAQTVADLEVLVVGDGVSDENRAVIEKCVAADPRVRFLDLPKGVNRGERNRHVGVGEAAAPAIAYLADDDLLLPRHVENVLGLLETVDLCQSLNGYITPSGELALWPTDLSQRHWLDWHLAEPPRNRVSITGTAHTKDSYLRVERGWDVAPPGMWTDLYLWRQFFELRDLRAATHPEMTTLQFPADARHEMSADAVREQRAQWEKFIAAPGAHERLQDLVLEARARQVIELSARVTDLELAATDPQEQVELKATLESLRAELDQRSVEAAELTAQRDALVGERAVLSAERDALVGENAVLGAARDELTTQRDQLTTQRDELTAKYDDMTAQRDQLVGERDAALDVLRETQALRDAALNRLHETQVQRDAFEAETQALRATLSWRITAPLRRIRSVRPPKASGS